MALAPELLCRRRTAAVDRSVWVATLPIPDHRLPDGTALVALRHPTEYPMLGERLVSTPLSDGTRLDIAAHEWRDHFTEEHVEHSTALHGRMLAGGDYMVGPMARFALNFDHLAPRAAAVAAEIGLTPAERNPFRSILIRTIETIHACEVALAMAEAYTLPERSFVPVEPRPASGVAGRKRRAVCCGTATRSTTTAASPPPRSCPRRRRTSPGSSTI